MIDALLVFAVLCACLGAFKDAPGGRIAVNVTALALLASTALTSLLMWQGVPFNVGLWLLNDIAVMAVMAANAIARGRMVAPDWCIMALFPLAWFFYARSNDPVAPDATTLIVSAQLLLTFPAGNVWKRINQKREQQPDIFDEFDLRAAHGEPGG
jgi:hypothetical protein